MTVFLRFGTNMGSPPCAIRADGFPREGNLAGEFVLRHMLRRPSAQAIHRDRQIRMGSKGEAARGLGGVRSRPSNICIPVAVQAS